MSRMACARCEVYCGLLKKETTLSSIPFLVSHVLRTFSWSGSTTPPGFQKLLILSMSGSPISRMGCARCEVYLLKKETTLSVIPFVVSHLLRSSGFTSLWYRPVATVEDGCWSARLNAPARKRRVMR